MKKLLICLCTLFYFVSCAENFEYKIDMPDVEEPEIVIPEPGQGSGEDFVIIKGKFNVISLYSYQENSEFVRVTDGAVAYVVYNKDGEIAPYAKVSGLPGIDPDIVFVADENGSFIVDKDILPKDKGYYGKTTNVTWNEETDESAGNTYVPAKIDVRIIISSAPYLKSDYTVVPYIVQRRVKESANWENIPTYLGELKQTIKGFEINKVRVTNIDKDISLSQEMEFARDILDCPYMSTYMYSLKWDSDNHYVKLELSQYYGETPITEDSVLLAPVQMVPIIGNLIKTTLINDEDGETLISNLKGKFTDVDYPIDYSLVYKQYFEYNNNLWNPIVDDKNTIDEAKVLQVSFNKTTSSNVHSVNNSNDKASLNSPNFGLNFVYIGSTTVIQCTNWYFKTQWNLGSVQETEIKAIHTGFSNIPIN